MMCGPAYLILRCIGLTVQPCEETVLCKIDRTFGEMTVMGVVGKEMRGREREEGREREGES